LDIGCGAGHLINIIRRKRKKVYGIEPDKKLVELSMRLYGKLPIYKRSIFYIDKIDNKFDTITVIDVLEHIKDDNKALKLISKKMKKNGKLIIVVPASPFLYGIRDKKLGHFRRYNIKQLRCLLDKSGFNIQEIRFWNTVGIFPYFISEKIFHKELNQAMLRRGEGGIVRFCLNKLLGIWFNYVENKINFGFGLSIFCIATIREQT
jgi:SAM-dependent methyltransferase